MKKLLLILLLITSASLVMAKPLKEVEADTTVDKHTVKKILHWVSVFTMFSDVDLSDKVDLQQYAAASDLLQSFVQNPELSLRLNAFRQATFVNVYPKGLLNGDEWILKKLNEISDAQYSSLNAPYVTLEVWFFPDPTAQSYTVTAIFKTTEDKLRNAVSKVNTTLSSALLGKTYAQPKLAKADVNAAIFTSLDALQAEIGSAFAPELAIRYDNILYLNNQTIEVWQKANEGITLVAVDKNNVPLTGTLTWTGIVGTGNTVKFPISKVGLERITVKGDGSPIGVLIKVKEFNIDLNSLLRRLIGEALSARKKKATDTLALLRQDSTKNARDVANLITELEKNNFPLENMGAALTPAFPAPITLTGDDTLAFKDPANTHAKSFSEIRKRKRIHKTMRHSLNVAAFADLVIKDPNRLTTLADDLVKNSGELIAGLILGKDSKGQEDVVKSIAIDYLNNNLERIVGEYTANVPYEERPLPVPPVIPTAPPVFDVNKYLYISPQVRFANNDVFRKQLEDTLRKRKTYAFINYSQDINTDAYLTRAKGARPKGLPQDAKYKVYTVVNIPGSVDETVLCNDCKSTAGSSEEAIKEDIFDYTPNVVLAGLTELVPFSDKGVFTFLSASGLPVTLPGNTQEVVFRTGERWNTDKFKISAFGTLAEFTIDDKKYVSKANVESNSFFGYYSDNSKQYYIDSLSEYLKPTNAIIGFPCYNAGIITFKVYQKDIPPSTSYTSKYLSAGQLREFDLLRDFFISGRTGKRAIEITAATNNLSQEALSYLRWRKEYASCDNPLSLYVFTHAFQITYHPGTYVNCDLDDDLAISNSKYYPPSIDNIYSEKPITNSVDEYFNEVGKWSAQIDIYKKRSDALASLRNITKVTDVDKIVEIFKTTEPYACNWDNLEVANRIYAFNKLLEGRVNDYWLSFGNDKENLFNLLLENTPIDDRKAVLDELSSKGSYSLLRTAYSKLNLGANDKFIASTSKWIQQSNLSEVSRLQLIRKTPATNGWIVPDELFLWELEDGDVKEKKLTWRDDGYLQWYSNDEKKYKPISPFDLIKIRFQSNFPGGISKDTEYIAPAIWAYRFEENLRTGELLNTLRILIDGVVIVSSFGTGSPVIAAIELGITSTDVLIIANSESLIKEFGSNGESWLKTWDDIYAMSAIAGLGIRKIATEAGKLELKLTTETLNTSTKSLGADIRTELKGHLTSLAVKLRTLHPPNWEAAYYRLQDFVRTMDLQSLQKIGANVTAKVTDYTRMFVFNTILNVQVARFDIQSGVPYLYSIRWLPDNVIITSENQIIERLNPISYENRFLQKVEKETLEIVLYEGSFYIREGLYQQLSPSLKSVYNELFKAGLKTEQKANSILFKNTADELVAILFKNKLTPIKWKPWYEFSSRIETSEGYWILKDGNGVYFDLGFKEGRILEAKEVNDYLINSGRAQKEGQPYMVGTFVTERTYKVGDPVPINFIESYNNGIPSPGGFGTNQKITFVYELRYDLGVLEEWKPTSEIPTFRQYKAINSWRTREGLIGPQLEKSGPNAGQIYPGGGHQYEIIENLRNNEWRNFFKEIGTAGGNKLTPNVITEATQIHVLKGEINSSGKAVGCHFKGALDNGSARLRPGSSVTAGPDDMFKSLIDIKDANGNWIPKDQQSSFFPRTWTEQKILMEIQNAFKNKVYLSGNTWKGKTSEGFEIAMYLKTDGTDQIISAFPIF